MTIFEENLARLIGCSVLVADSGFYPVEGAASVVISFTNGTKLRADYWRLFKDKKRYLSSFDHRQKYGLPAPIDAIVELQNALEKTTVSGVTLDSEAGDIILRFGDPLKLQVLNFTGYEIWEIRFPDGTGQYSNYV